MTKEEVLDKVGTGFLKGYGKSSAIRLDVRMARLYAHKGLDLDNGRTLRFLLRKDASDVPGTIADELGISRSQMTGVADQLEKMGYVTRVRDRRDRRVQHLVLTEAGRAAAEDLEGHCQMFHFTVMSYLDEEELRTFFRVRKQIEDEMLRQLDLYDKTGSFQKKGK